jgi:hypothetical protein
MLERERKGLVSMNTQLNCKPTPHKRELERKLIARPKSPTAELQTRKAMECRKKRKAYFMETGVELGAGESVGYKPKELTPPKKGVRWGVPLELGYDEELQTHSPSQAKLTQAESGVLIKDNTTVSLLTRSVSQSFV